MSIKENLIFALENAEENYKEIELGYISSDGLMMTSLLTPEVMINDDEIEVCDASKGMACRFVIELNNSLMFDGEMEEYSLTIGNGRFSFRFS